MNVVRNTILKLTTGGSYVLSSLAFPPLVAVEGMTWGTGLATALGNVAAGNTANAVDALIDGGEGGVSLKNQDLTKAVGKAIAAVITLATKSQRGKTRQHLEKIAAQAAAPRSTGCQPNWPLSRAAGVYHDHRPTFP